MARLAAKTGSQRAAPIGIVNRNGREPSVESKLETHKKIIALDPFKTSHRIVLGDARSMDSVPDES
ncbi:MAG TPA: hypothetical protein VGR85_03430, partial [Candidatus Limnocylindria bacterium]|nr:hypothetical protein [Candidatus Limnocylindria bacterium]